MAESFADSGSKNLRTVEEFYDLLAPSYDQLTNMAGRFEKEREVFQTFVQEHGIGQALDAGCGSGFHSILLSQLGVRMTAIDVSEEMVKLTRRNAATHSVSLEIARMGFTDLPGSWEEKFDAVFVMGNSLPHLLSRAQLKDALRSLLRVLRRGGLLVAQCLNYDRILAQKERVLNARSVGGSTLIREYEYDDSGIRFSIVTRPESESSAAERRETVMLRPVLKQEFESILRELAENAEFFGDLRRNAFDPSSSPDLVMFLTKHV